MNNNSPKNRRGNTERYDLTEEASKRPHDDQATDAARYEESDDANERLHQENVSSPGGDDWAENKVETLDD